MFHLSNGLIGILNSITFLLSIPILGGGVWLSRQAATECDKFYDVQMTAVGGFLMVVSFAGLVGACCGVTWLLSIYLLVMFILIILLFCFTVFAFVVVNKGAGETVPGKGHKEYRLGDYSSWLQKRVGSRQSWKKIKSCLQVAKLCKPLTDDHTMSLHHFNQKPLSSMQSGCCKPPYDCNFTYVSPTVWTKTTATAAATNPDCGAWSNQPNTLCFNCESCKAGLVDSLRSNWKRVSIINVILLIFLLAVYSIGCCAFRNNREDSALGQHP